MRLNVKLEADEIQVGEISGLHGVQGWVKIFSDTQPRENIFKYMPWRLYGASGMLSVEVPRWRKQGKTLVAKLSGIESRDSARELLGSAIAINRAQLPVLAEGEFYWSQLTGLRVKTSYSADSIDLGVVKGLMETGSNDVLVVQGDSDSLDENERLIPWVPEQFVLDVDIQAGEIEVNWDPEF